MKVYKYKNYDEYVTAQKTANIKKKNNIWAIEENIKFISEYLKDFNPEYGLCHGTRQGFEQEWFMKYLTGCDVIGSEIGEIKAKNTVRWDFNKVNPEWIGKFDFIYSNSFDHAYCPENTLKVWSEQLKLGGCIILEYDRRQEHTGDISMPANRTDPVSITVDELKNLIPKWIDNLDKVIVVDLPIVKIEWQKAVIISVN